MKSKRPAVNLWILLAALVIVTGCSVAGGSSETTSPLEVREARVQVVNKGWSEMVIYLNRSGSWLRLGSVNSLSQAELAIPRGVLNTTTSVRLGAAPIGSNARYTSGNVAVGPGQIVAFEIQDNLRLSNVTVRNQ